MRNALELNKYGIVELNSTEMTEIEGGRTFLGWLSLGLQLAAAILGFAGQ